MDDELYRVRDEEHSFEFRGRCLAKTSSASEGKLRWTEVELYRTSSGRYVVATLGRSADPTDATFWRATVSETARGAVELLYQQDRDGVRYLTWTARQALEEASALDEELREAYQVQVID